MAWEKSVKTLNRTNNIVPELTAKMAKGKKRNTLTRSKSGFKKKKEKKESLQPGQRRPPQSP